jgi:plasmid replication initiation protein
MKRVSVLKASGAITHENSITLVQRQIWNVLLSHANDKIDQEQYSIPARLLFAQKDFKLDHYDELQAHLTALVETPVKWNIYKKDKRSWGVSTFLASAFYNAETGMLEFSYSSHLKEMLKLPKSREELRERPYLKLSLGIQSKFKSKHSQFLYEFLSDLYNPRRKTSMTNWITLEDFEEMCHTNYARWDKIKDRLIVNPINEIVEITPFTIHYQPMKALNRVTHVRFRLVRKEAIK